MRAARIDPTRRTAGQYARETVLRLRLRTLVIARRAGGGDGAARARRSACTTRASWRRRWRCSSTMFVISRYVLPLVERRDRGAQRRGARRRRCWRSSRTTGWRVIHDASLGHGNVDHILSGRRACSRSRRRATRARSAWGACTARRSARRATRARRWSASTGLECEPLIVYSRAWVDRPLRAGAGRAGAAGADARRATSQARADPQRGGGGGRAHPDRAGAARTRVPRARAARALAADPLASASRRRRGCAVAASRGGQ